MDDDRYRWDNPEAFDEDDEDDAGYVRAGRDARRRQDGSALHDAAQ